MSQAQKQTITLTGKLTEKGIFISNPDSTTIKELLARYDGEVLKKKEKEGVLLCTSGKGEEITNVALDLQEDGHLIIIPADTSLAGCFTRHPAGKKWKKTH